MRTTRGFTLVELMVSMAIGLFIVAATFTFLTGPGFGQVCSGGSYEKDDIVLFQSEDTFDARAAKILTFTPGMACLSGTCIHGCDSMTWEQDDTYLAGRSSFGADYEGGEMSGGFTDVVWFEFEGNLRRAEINSTSPCTSRNETCGQVVDFDVDTLQARVLQWDASAGAWEDRTVAQSVTDPRRVRVDVEMVVRARKSRLVLRAGRGR
jgi:prepilin-type N-terminal cleavage/methylation domain-containing protein